ncbi:hypothetical protein [Dongia sp.]|uniref:hypothetical protein n=1 Tax=Dongia sp. TaxID=1977262 RepID=UPI0035B380E5
MPQPNLGPVYRHLADVMGKTAEQIRKEIDKLRAKIRKRLPPNQRDRFDKDWEKAKDTKGRRRAAVIVLGKVTDRVLDLGEAVDPNYAGAEPELWALIDMLRALEGIEDMEKHFDDMAKAFGS